MPPKDGSFPHYETLSYVWGPDSKSAAVKVDRPGNDGPARLAVTETLLTALRYLRRGVRKRNLWIDALCLNQADKLELSQQVPRMGEIYHLAYNGTAWLGVQGNGSEVALKTLRHLGEQVVAEGESGLLFASPDTDKKTNTWFDPDVSLPFDEATWESVAALLRRPWFTRLWVVQEIHPGAVLQCGHDTIPIAAFAEAQYCLYCKTHLPPGLRSQMTQVDGTLSRFWVMALPRLLYRAAAFKTCADPRDKIYGLLGLAPTKFAHGIEVDYREGNTAADVFRMAVLSHAKVTERLEHFHNCFETDERAIPEGPSWVPDWVSACPGETYIPSQFVATTSRAHIRYSDETPGKLEALGIRFGKVVSTTVPLPKGLARAEKIQHIRKWQPDDMDTEIYGPTGEPMRKAYAITLICNGLREREPDWIVSFTEDWAQQDFDEALFGDKATDSSSSEERQDVSDALQCCTERLFFTTVDGHIGLGPATTREGDVLAVILGTPNAVILRPDSMESGFRVVGECFVYGIHDSIPLLGPFPEMWTGIAAWVHGDRRVLRFLNTQTKESSVEDPRLEALPPGWERIDKTLERDDPTLYDFFQNKDTGEVVNYDPRLEPEALQQRGVHLDRFSLI